MEFKKIQLNGFKSFAEKTDFLIEDGLTGIVGPNGCGKSNIVESLRRCMGETSAKSMRGSGMEDVIFSGTSNKPPKNISEVIIHIDNLDYSKYILLFGPNPFKSEFALILQVTSQKIIALSWVMSTLVLSLGIKINNSSN